MNTTKVSAYGKDFSYLKKLAQDANRKLCIYGCGVNGEVICDYLKQQGKDIAFFVDRQAEGREFTVLGKNVISPSTYFALKDDTTILISQDDQLPILGYLKENGVSEDAIICPFKQVERQVRVLPDTYSPSSYKGEYQNAETVPKATIFTILYNTPSGMLCRTIESILAQSVTDFEYLLIDNGSTDHSADMISEYAKKDCRIHYVRLEKNVPWTNRKLLETLRDNIHAPYVAMVDSDDYYEPSFLEKTLHLVEADQSDIVQVNTLTYAHEGFRYSYFNQNLGKDICVSGEEKEKLLLLRIIGTPTWGKLYRSTLLKTFIDYMLSYDTEYARDRYFCLDISWISYLATVSERVSLCDELLHVRTWRPGSSEHSDNHSSKWLSSIVWAFNRLQESGIEYDKRNVYEDAALMWLFSLPRDTYDYSVFRPEDIENRRVREFVQRPVCDKFRR